MEISWNFVSPKKWEPCPLPTSSLDFVVFGNFDKIVCWCLLHYLRRSLQESWIRSVWLFYP